MTARRRFVVHIGPHKTGSTALQTFLAREETSLTSFGARIPETGRIHPIEARQVNHADIAWDVMKGDGSVLNRACAELADSDADILLLTAEDFSFFAPNHAVRLFAAIPDGRDAEVVYYRRPLTDRARSAYAHRHRQDKLRTPFTDWWPGVILKSAGGRSQVAVRFDDAAIVGRWADAGFRVHVREYEAAKARPGGLVADFMEVLGASSPNGGWPAPTRVNVGMMCDDVISADDRAALDALTAGIVARLGRMAADGRVAWNGAVVDVEAGSP